MIQEELLLKYLQGECSELELQEVLQWLKKTPENQKYLFQMEEIWGLGKVQRFSQDKYLKKAHQKLLTTIAERKVVKNKRFSFAILVKCAAAVVLLLSTTLTYKYFSAEEFSPSNQLVTIKSSDKIRNFILPDGSKIWLNKHSLLSFEKAFCSHSTREVTLVGQGYFEVAKDKKKQFIVHTDLMNIKVQGTIFNVNAPKGALKVETTLVEGSVLIEGTHHEGNYLLSPGEKAEIVKDGSVIEIIKTDPMLDVVWKDGLFPFNQANIREIAVSLERYYDVKISISASVNLQNTYSGVLRQNDSIDKVLNSLKNTIPISYKIKAGKIFIDKVGVY